MLVQQKSTRGYCRGPNLAWATMSHKYPDFIGKQILGSPPRNVVGCTKTKFWEKRTSGCRRGIKHQI